MATCIIEDASTTTSIYCQTTDTMERTPTSPSLESSSTINSEHSCCSFNFSTNNIKNESTRKRQLSQNEITDHSCRSQAVPINKNNDSM
jgi:hypothetical protein